MVVDWGSCHRNRANFLKETFGIVDEDSPFTLKLAVNIRCTQTAEREINKALVKKVMKQALE